MPVDIREAVVPQHCKDALVIYPTRHNDFLARGGVFQRFHYRLFILLRREVAHDNKRLCARTAQVGIDDSGDMLIWFQSSYNQPVFVSEEIVDFRGPGVFSYRTRIPRHGDGFISTVADKNDLVLVARWHVWFQLLVIDNYVTCRYRGQLE